MARDDHQGRISEQPPSPAPAGLTAAELDEWWFQECERRMRRVESGQDKLIPHDEAMKYIFASIPGDKK